MNKGLVSCVRVRFDVQGSCLVYKGHVYVKESTLICKGQVLCDVVGVKTCVQGPVLCGLVKSCEKGSSVKCRGQVSYAGDCRGHVSYAEVW